MAQLLDRPGLELPDPLPGEAELLADLLERVVLLALHPEAPAQEMYAPRPMQAPHAQSSWAPQSSPMMTMPEQPMQAPAEQRKWLPFILWGVLFAVIGFVIVGVVLHFTK